MEANSSQGLRKRKVKPTVKEREPGKSKAKTMPKCNQYIGDITDPNVDEFVADNPFLLTGFRIGFHTYWDAARSLFMVHNETMNVWSHLLGAIGFLCTVVYVLVYLQPIALH